MRPIQLLLASAGSTLILAGCAFMSAASIRHSSPMIHTIDMPLILSPRSTGMTTAGKQHQRPSQPGSTQGTVLIKAIQQPAPIKAAQQPGPIKPTPQPASPTPSPLPPTPLPATPTAISTPRPIVNSAASEEHHAPEVPNRLLIPAINLDVPVVAMGWSVIEQDGQAVSQWDVPNWRAAGWLNTSAPVGVPGNTVLEGHQDIDGRVFENLEYLKEGDEIQLQTSARTRKYIVALRTIVPEKDQPPEVRHENARWIGPSSDERLTLVTCWPRNDNTHRLILVALPVP